MKKLRSLNLSIHAGHDLNLQNLGPLIQAFPDINEVSIGQAFVADCLYYGLENTHGLYKRAIATIWWFFAVYGDTGDLSGLASSAVLR